MKKVFSAGALLFTFAGFLFGQEIKPAPTPPPADNDVVKISTNLIQIDVTVTDRKGKPITDLRPEEIEIYENGEKQKITSLSFISSTRATVEKPAVTDKNAVPVPSAVLRPEQVRRTMALVVDDLSLSFESAYHTRRALKKFVDEQMQDGDLVAIIRTGAGIGALQQFTSDKRLLYAAIEKVRWNPTGSGKIGAFAPIEPTPSEILRASGDDSVTEEDIQAEKNRINSFNDFQGSLFATGTLGALKFVITGMGELPGRKSVILFSDGFRLTERDEFGYQSGGRVIDFLLQLVDLANRSSVVFYTIDARGLQTTALTAQDQVVDTSPEASLAAQSERRDELLETQAGLAYLAEETGGFPVRNNNDLSGGVRRVLEDQSYYLVAYEPDADTFDAEKRKFNKLEVKVTRKDVKVRYRSGFFNIVDSKYVAGAPAAGQSPAQQLTWALTSPFAVNGISLRLNALFGYESTKGAYVRSLLHVNARDLKFTDMPGNVKKAVFDVLATSFGDNGQQIDQLARSYTLTASGETYKRIVAEGFVYHFAFPVKKAGAYQYRVAIRDSQGDKVGSASQFIEVPDVKKDRLVVSSIILESLSVSQWQKISDPNGGNVGADPMTDTALRRIKAGSVLRYGFETYNAKLGPAKEPSLDMQIRVFRDGQLILAGQRAPIDYRGQNDFRQIKASGAIALGAKIVPGDYILQIIITDNAAKGSQKIATQFVQFEVVN